VAGVSEQILSLVDGRGLSRVSQATSECRRCSGGGRGWGIANGAYRN
jgi:hypothetical protein